MTAWCTYDSFDCPTCGGSHGVPEHAAECCLPLLPVLACVNCGQGLAEHDLGDGPATCRTPARTDSATPPEAQR